MSTVPQGEAAPPLRVVLAAEGLRFSWPGMPRPCIDIEALRITAGEAVFLHGPSGCGKSTLLSLLAGVLVADEGRVTLLGHDWSQLSGAARDRCRVAHVGYIFQQFNLLPYLSVLDNVLLPCRFSQRRESQAARGGSAREEASTCSGRWGSTATCGSGRRCSSPWASSSAWPRRARSSASPRW